MKRWVVAVRAAMPSPRPQGWQALQMAVGLADSGAEVTLVADAAHAEGVPGEAEAWLGRTLPAGLLLRRPARPHRPPLAGVLFRHNLRRSRSRDAVLLCRDPRVAASNAGRWNSVVMEWHVRPEPSDRRHRAALAADLHVTVASGLRQDLLDAGVPEDRVLLLPNACGLDPVRAARRSARPGQHVLALGLHRRGGLDLAIRTWATHGDLPPLLIAGQDQDGLRTAAWQAQIDGLGLHDRVRLVGGAWGSEREDLIDGAAAWLALYPADDDTRTRLCPLQVADALGSGVPLVASDLPAIRALAGDGAEYPSEAEPEALAAALHRALCRERRVPNRPDWAARARQLRAAVELP